MRSLNFFLAPVSNSRLVSVSAPLSQNSLFLTDSYSDATTCSSDDEQQFLRQLYDEKIDCRKVCGVLNRFRGKPEVAFSIFRFWNQLGYEHDLSTYSIVIAILSNWGLHKKLKSILSQLIASEDFNIIDLFECLASDPECSDNRLAAVVDGLVKIYASKALFEEAIDSLFQTRRRGLFPRISTCNFLINRMINHGNTEKAISLYKFLKKAGLVPNDYTYAIAIKAFCKIDYFEEAANVFKEMEDVGVEPTAFAYSTYIAALCKKKSDAAYQLLQTLTEDHKVQLGSYIYAAVIQVLCNEKKLEKAHSVLLLMENEGLVPSSECYKFLIHEYCSSGNLPRAMDLHDDMLSKGGKTNCFIISYILQGLCSIGKLAEVVDIFNRCSQSGTYMDKVTYNIHLDALCKLGKLKEATKLIEEMKKKKITLDHIVYTTLIHGYCCQGDMSKAEAVLDEMKIQGIDPDLVTCNVLAGGYAKGGLVSRVHQLLHYTKSLGLNPNTCMENTIIKGLCIGGEMREAENFLKGLKASTEENRGAMISGYIQADCTREAYKLFMHCYENQIPVKRTCCFKLLRNLCIAGDDHAIKLLKIFLLDYREPSNAMFNDLLASSCRGGHLNMAAEIYNISTEWGMKPDVFTLTVLLDGQLKEILRSKRTGLTDEAKRIALALKDVSLKVEENEVTPDVFLYTIFISGLCKLGKLEEAEQMLCGMAGKGLEPDLFIYSVLIVEFIKWGEVEKAKQLYEEMLRKGLCPDNKIEKIVSDLAHGNRYLRFK